jgi:hypothetical protein
MITRLISSGKFFVQCWRGQGDKVFCEGGWSNPPSQDFGTTEIQGQSPGAVTAFLRRHGFEPNLDARAYRARGVNIVACHPSTKTARLLVETALREESRV